MRSNEHNLLNALKLEIVKEMSWEAHQSEFILFYFFGRK